MQDIRIGGLTLDDSDNVTSRQVKGGAVIGHWELNERMPPEGILEVQAGSGYVAIASPAAKKRLQDAGLAYYLGGPVSGVRVTNKELEVLYCTNDSISDEYPRTIVGLIGLDGVIRMLREREREALVEVTFTRREV